MKADTPKTYRLVELVAENFKILRAVRISPDRSVFKISGANAQGKSSVLDIVSAAIGGAALCPKQAIRKGQDEAMVSVDFGALKATRRFRRRDDGSETSDLTVEFSDGKRPKKPQDVLNELRGSPIADDPLEFSRLKPKERYDLLKQLVPDFDFDAMAAKRKDLFDDRTAVGRDYERAKGAAASIQAPPDAPLAPVDVSELASKVRLASESNAKIDRMATEREAMRDKIEELRDEADRLKAQAKANETAADSMERSLVEFPPLPDKFDVSSIEQQIRDAETTNAGARKRAEKVSREGEAKALSDRYDVLTASLKAMDEAKVKAIESAKLPVPELSFGDDDIMLDGLPFDQASTARKIRVSTALLMALKPELRVLLVREGSLLDDEARAELEAMAAANNFVVLMECVGAGDGTGIVIENGEVVS